MTVIEVIAGTLLTYTLLKLLFRKTCHPDYTNKTVWITGASSGIGQAMAYQFSKANAQIIISARNVKQLQRVKSGCLDQSKVTVIGLDMTDFEAVKKVSEKVVRELEEKGKKLDVVVENAGISMRCQFKDYDFKNHLAMFDVNVNGPFVHMQAILPHMIKNKSGQIVGISSAQGKLATMFRTSYAGSKHAILGILDSIRSQVYEHNIKVTTILPGYVQTNISKNAFGSEAGSKFGETDNNIKSGMSAQDFAKQAVQAIYRGQNQVQISKQFLVPLGFVFRNLWPDAVFYGLRQFSKKHVKAEPKK